MADNNQQLQNAITQFLKLVNESPIPTELEEIPTAPDPNHYMIIQKGTAPANKVSIDKVRGFGGNYNPSNNTPELSDGTGAEKQYYYVTEDGIRDFGSGDISLKAGDFIEYKNGTWSKMIQARDIEDASLNINSNYAY